MKLEYLQEADLILSKCGRPILPGGVTAVPIPKSYLMPMILHPGQSATFTKEITGRVPWLLRAISSDQASASLVGIRVQIQLPNGRFLFGGNGVDAGQFCWVGSWRWLQDPELRCEPGTRIQVTLTDTTSGGLAEITAVNLVFEGADLHFLRGGAPANPGPLASTLPRYQGIVNENILAPAWVSNEGIETPFGSVDEYFIYSTADPTDQPLIATWQVSGGQVVTAPTPAPFEIQIDPGYDFYVRRMLFDLQIVSTSGSLDPARVLGKVRTGAGFVLNDSFIDLQKYLCGAEFPGRFMIKGGDSVFIDTALADIPDTAAGSVTFQVFLEGYRRTKA